MMENKSKKKCVVCGAIAGDNFIHPYLKRTKKVRVCSYHIIPKSWSGFSEFKDQKVLLCTRCHSCCPPFIIAAYNHILSHKVTKVLNKLFPELEFKMERHDCGNPKCQLNGGFFIDIKRKN